MPHAVCMTKYVAVCCRISKDKSGRTEGVKAQEKWGRAYAAEHWPDLPTEVFADGDNSAMNGGPRPGHDRFREWLNSGRIAQVWAVEQSRLERDEIKWFELAAELDAAGIAELHTNRDGVVRVRDEVAGIKAVLNASEVRKMKQRVKDRLAEVAAAGRPPGGRVFGYQHVNDPESGKTLEIIPEQAEVIRWAADKILDGWSLTNVATELNNRGFTGAKSGKITVSSVRSICTNPAIAGLRVHQGRIVGPGIWEPILSDNTRQAVIAKLSAERVVRRRGGGSYPVGTGQNGKAKGRRYVLTGGLAVCGVCEKPLAGTVRKRRTKTGVTDKTYLVCVPANGGSMCVGILMAPTEAHVVNELFGELDRPEFLDALDADDSEEHRKSVLEALSACERQRNELAKLWATPGDLTAAEWQTARRAIAEQEQQLRQELAAIPVPRGRIDIEEARTAYPYMTLDEKRQFLSDFIERVTIARAVPGARAFDPARVSIRWRTL